MMSAWALFWTYAAIFVAWVIAVHVIEYWERKHK